MNKVRRILLIISAIVISLNINIKNAFAVNYKCKDGDEHYYDGLCREYTEEYECPRGFIQPNGKKSPLCVTDKEKKCKTGNAVIENEICVVYWNPEVNHKGEHICSTNIEKSNIEVKTYQANTGKCKAVLKEKPEKLCPAGTVGYDASQCRVSGRKVKKTTKIYKAEVVDSSSSNDSDSNSSSNDSNSNSSNNDKPIKKTKDKTNTKKITKITCPRSFEVDKGKSKIIGLKIQNAKINDAKIKSNNKKIATVKKKKKNGKSYIQVTGKKEGTTKIKIEVGGKSQYCDIKVNKKDTQTKEENDAESIVNEGINDISNEVDSTGVDSPTTNNNTEIKTIKCPSKTPTVEVGKTKKISYKVKPTNASTNNVEFIIKGGSKDNIKITNTNPLKVKGLKKGTGKIVIKYNGKTTTCKIKVKKTNNKSNKIGAKKPDVKKITISYVKTMYVGEKRTLIANVSPAKSNQGVKWKSSNKKIATVNENGQVTAKKEGSVTITVTSKENKKISKSKKIKIKSSMATSNSNTMMNQINVTSISIAPTKTVSVDGRKKYKVNYSPVDATNKKVKWSSSNKKIVTVDSDGTIVGHKKGTAIITAVSMDNKNAVSKSTVTVTAKNQVKSVVVNPTKVTMNVGETKTIHGTIIPSDVSNKLVTWKSSNKKVATVDENGQIKAIKKGKVTITATSRTDATKKAKVKVTVKKNNNNSKEDKIVFQGITPSVISMYAGNKSKIVISNSNCMELKSNTTNLTGTLNNNSTNDENITNMNKKLKICATGSTNKSQSKKVKFIDFNYKIIENKNDTESTRNVISIDTDGTITALRTGTAKVAFSLKNVENTNNESSIVTIKVLKKIKPTSLELNCYPKTMGVKDTYSLKKSVTLSPSNSNSNLIYKTSNKKIITVSSNGKLTAKKVGTATITITSGSNTNVKQSFKVKVTKKGTKTSLTKCSSSISKPEESKSEDQIENDTPTEEPAVDNTDDDFVNEPEWGTDANNNFNISINIGDEVDVPWLDDAEFVPENYTYVTTDSSVISVSESGTITALKIGTASIKLIEKSTGTALNQIATVNVIETNENNESNNETKTEENTQSNTGSSKEDNNDLKSNVKKEKAKVSKYNKIVLIGDSRFVGQQKNGYKNSSITYIAKVSQGLSYLKNKKDTIKKYDSKKTAYVINLGVNDLGNKKNYVKYVNNLAKGIKGDIYYLSINPVDENKEKKNGYKVKNSNIKSFNSYLKKNLKGVKYLDSYSILEKKGFSTTDGVHYTKGTYKKIYEFIINNVK